MVKSTNVFTAVVVVILSIFYLEFLNTKKPKHPNTGLNTVELVEKYGYPVETHEVTTEDGYILTLHRIPHGPQRTQQKRVPVLFMHGLMISGVDFVVLGPGKALGLLLADEGLDVWLGNVRGTTWSKKHKKLDPYRDPEYWDFSLHEMGFYDAKTFIDYILTVTGQSELQYVGFSQGTTIFFILTSERPEYATKVKLMTAMAPAIFLKNPQGLFLTLASYFRGGIEMIFNVLNMKEFLSNDSLIAIYLKTICHENSMFVELCLYHIFSTQGFNPEGTNKTMLSLIYTNSPAGMSTKQLLHILQLMGTGNFQKYDLGTSGNQKTYGQKEPPSYNLSKTTTPVALYYCKNDWTVNIENIQKIKEQLPNVVKSYQVPLESFNHDDFVHSDHASVAVYRTIIEEILKYI